jgi:predicted small lipoprotein YifL
VRSGVALAFALVALAGCGELEHYETTDGEPTRLDGSEPTARSISVAEAAKRPVLSRFYVRGYLYLPPDDERRLCEQMSSDSACDGASLVIANPHPVGSMAADGVLEHGCCAIGAWSPREVVVSVWLARDRRAYVLG